MFKISSLLIKILILIAIISNVFASIPFVVRLRHGAWPRTSDFGAVSIFVYYSIGLISEVFQPEQLGEILPVFGQSDQVTIISLCLIAAAPWILHLGSWFSAPKYQNRLTSQKIALPARSRRLFLSLALAFCLVIGIQGLSAVVNAPAIWTLRVEMGEKWGPWIVWFYIPMSFLVLLISTTETKKMSGKLACAFIFITAISAAVPIGERTILLLPLLLVLMFSRGLTLRRAVLVPAIAFVCAGLLLPTFKFQFGADDFAFKDLMFSTIHGDISRAGVLGNAVARSEMVGSRIMPYPMSGYVYSAAFFLPRSVVPWKGNSTAQCFTANVTNTQAGETNWGYGLGLIEEAIINGGIVLSIPILFGYGFLMGFLDKLSSPVLILPIRLAALWIGGYHLPAMLQTFGPMLFVATAFLVMLSISKRFSFHKSCLGIFLFVRSRYVLHESY